MALPFDHHGKYIKRNDPKRLEIKPDLTACINIKIPYTLSSSSSLARMTAVAKRVKELNPDHDLMEINDDTIGVFADDPYFEDGYGMVSSKRLPYAYYSYDDQRIYCNPEMLKDRTVRINYANALALKIPLHRWQYVALRGDLALVFLICHEIAHHETWGHAKNWKVKFSKFFWQIIMDIRRLQ